MSPHARLEVTPRPRFAEAWRQRLARSEALRVEHLGPVRGDRVLAVLAHPDDEVLAMGATLAALAGAGVTVDVVSLSRGESALRHLGHEVPGLAARRAGELRAAADALGVGSAVALGLPDGRLADHEEEAADAVRLLVEERAPDYVLTLWRDDPHPDHRAASAVARRLAGPEAATPVLEMPLWAMHWTDPADVLVRVRPVAVPPDARRARQEALGCYVSQLEPLLGEVQAVLPEAVAAWETECLVVQP